MIFGCVVCKQAEADLLIESKVSALSARGERVVEKIRHDPNEGFRVCFNCALRFGLKINELAEEASEGIELKVHS